MGLTDRKLLPVKHISEHVYETDQEIKDGINGIQKTLITRWGRVNHAMMGGFRFASNYIIAGLSGHGKSWLLNLLIQDFLNAELNSKFYKKFNILHFGFEMEAKEEILRMISSKTGDSYEDLLSVNKKYDKYTYLDDVYKEISKRRLYIVEEPGSLEHVENTIYEFNKQHQEEELIVTLDHSLLVTDIGGDELRMISDMGKMFIRIKKRIGSMNIILGQLNGEIENQERRADIPSRAFLHYPIKKDLYGGKQLFHAANDVLIVHQPYLLGIEKYGKKQYPTEGLIALHKIKSRLGGRTGLIRLKQDLDHGNILEWLK